MAGILSAELAIMEREVANLVEEEERRADEKKREKEREKERDVPSPRGAMEQLARAAEYKVEKREKERERISGHFGILPPFTHCFNFFTLLISSFFFLSPPFSPSFPPSLPLLPLSLRYILTKQVETIKKELAEAGRIKAMRGEREDSYAAR